MKPTPPDRPSAFDNTPNPEAVPTPREMFDRLLSLERKFTRLHAKVAEFTDDVEKDFKGLEEQVGRFGIELEELKHLVATGHTENNLLLQGVSRAIERTEEKLDQVLARLVALP